MAFDFEALTSNQKVTAVYVAYYGRAADPDGRAFWSNQLDQSGGDLSGIIDAFGTSQEAVQRFGTLSNEAAVRTLFRDLFNREPDLDGLNFYVGELEAGRLSLQTIALDILNGAQNEDAAIVSNKIAAGEIYTDALTEAGLPAEIEDTRAAIAGVDETEGSVATARAATEAVTGLSAGITVQGDVLENDVPVTSLDSPAQATDVGTSATGFLGVTSGSNLSLSSNGFDNLQAGAGQDGSGTIVVSGSDTAIITNGTDNTVQVGRLGEGVLLVSDGARLETLQLEAGREGRGEILISGEGTEVRVTPENGTYSGEFSNQAGLVRAANAEGSFGRIVLSDGALLNVVATPETTGPGMNIAQDAGSRGEVVVDAATARFVQDDPVGDFGPFINVGRGGTGSLDVRNGGTVTVTGQTSGILVGRAGNEGQGDGTLSVTGGSRVETLFYNVAFDGGTGTVLVSGEGSTLAAVGAAETASPDTPLGQGAFLTVGRAGSGTLRVEDGGLVDLSTETGFFPGMQVGREVGSDGSVSVTGSGSAVRISNTNPETADSDVTIARAGEGNLTIEDGGALTGVLFLTIARNTEASGAVTVSGQGSLLEVSGAGGPQSSEAGQGGFITIGREGTATLRIEDGAVTRVTSETGDATGLQAGRNLGGEGRIIVDGTGSRLEIIGNGETPSLDSGWAKIGRGGTGRLEITDGGQVSHDALGVFVVGAEDGSNGSVTLSGNGSGLDAGHALLIGADVNVGPFSPDNVNFDTGATGTVTVGEGTQVEVGGEPNDGIADIFIGSNGTLEVESGGSLIGDVRVVGGSFDLAEGASHQGDLLM